MLSSRLRRSRRTLGRAVGPSCHCHATIYPPADSPFHGAPSSPRLFVTRLLSPSALTAVFAQRPLCLMLSWSGNGAGCELQLELQFTVNSYPFSVPRAVSPTPRCTVQRCTLYSEARYRSPRSTPMLGTCRGKRRTAAWSSPRRLSFASYAQCAQSDGELLGGRMRRSRKYAQRII